MDDFFEEYLAFEMFEESFCEETQIPCPNCEATLLLDRERRVFLCPDCRGEFEPQSEDPKE